LGVIGTAEQDAFISSQKWAVVTTLRADGSPSNSVVFFAREGDRLFFSTTDDRLKTRTVEHDPRIALCVLDEGAPYRFVNVEGTAAIERDDIVPGHVAINRTMRGDPAWMPPEGFEERLRRDRRVLISVTAERASGVVNR
jgi:PPOX class probable F420-dependent enzyme